MTKLSLFFPDGPLASKILLSLQLFNDALRERWWLVCVAWALMVVRVF